jgi:DNA sulfur modification protein DndD
MRSEDFIIETLLSRDGMVISGDQVEVEINQFTPEKISRFFLFDGELLQEYEELLIEGSEQGRQIKEAIEQVLGVPALINGRTELGSILKSATRRQSQEMAHIQGLERQAEQTARLNTRLETLERNLEKLQQRLNDTREIRSKLDDELEGASPVLALKASLDAARGRLKTHSEMLEKKREERQALLALAWQDLLDTKLEVKRSLLRDRQRLLTDSMKDGMRIQSKIEDIHKLLATNECPTCEQVIGNERRDALGTALGNLEIEATKFGDATPFQKFEVLTHAIAWSRSTAIHALLR